VRFTLQSLFVLTTTAAVVIWFAVTFPLAAVILLLYGLMTIVAVALAGAYLGVLVTAGWAFGKLHARMRKSVTGTRRAPSAANTMEA
jgi:hypothetical protein